MSKFLIFFLVLLLSACASQPEQQSERRFKIEFGNIIEVGEFYELEPNQFKVLIKNGVPVIKFGVRVQNLDRNNYELAFHIRKYNEVTDSYDNFAVGGYWMIKPPINPDYEAFLSEDDKLYLPGKYRFGIVLKGDEVIQSIDFDVVQFQANKPIKREN